MYVDAYGTMLDDLKAANDAIRSVVPPSAFERTAEAFRGLVRAIYDQVTAWPQIMRDSALRVRGDTFHIKLEVNVKHAPFERAMAADSKALGL
jgi:hypothetical protein